MPDIKPQIKFAKKTSSLFWHEQPSDHNPYLAEKCRIHGYDLIELMAHKSFVEVLYLIFCGELPNADQRKLLEQLMISQINPGPRHPATRAAMTAAISKTRPVNILPIGLMVLGGEHLGAAEVEQSMNFIRSHLDDDPARLADKLLTTEPPSQEGDWHIVPGFGSRFGGIDPIPNQLAGELNSNAPHSAIKWGQQFVEVLQPSRLGWLSTGISAAALLDLGISPREGSGLFQLMGMPGILAHGMEQTHRPFTDMPTVEDKDYVIE